MVSLKFYRDTEKQFKKLFRRFLYQGFERSFKCTHPVTLKFTDLSHPIEIEMCNLYFINCYFIIPYNHCV